MNPKQASLRGRIGAYRLHATRDSRETTAAARSKFLERFVDEVDPDRIQPEKERHRRASYARKAYFANLAFLSAKKRSKKSRGEHRAEASAESDRRC